MNDKLMGPFIHRYNRYKPVKQNDFQFYVYFCLIRSKLNRFNFILHFGTLGIVARESRLILTIQTRF